MCIRGVLHPICDLALSPAALDGRFVTAGFKLGKFGNSCPISLFFSGRVKGACVHPAELLSCNEAALQSMPKDL